MRKTKHGRKNLQDWNTQDHPRLNLTPQQRAIENFVNVVGLFTYVDLLPPAAQDIVRAAKIVANKMKGE